MSLNNIEEISFCIHQDAPKIHCLTNPVTMQDVANLLLAAGGSAVMGQDCLFISCVRSKFTNWISSNKNYRLSDRVMQSFDE